MFGDAKVLDRWRCLFFERCGEAGSSGEAGQLGEAEMFGEADTYGPTERHRGLES